MRIEDELVVLIAVFFIELAFTIVGMVDDMSVLVKIRPSIFTG